MDNAQTQLDPDIVNLAKATRQYESGNDPTKKGGSGEYGYYQYIPGTWASQSKAAGINVPLQEATPEQQNEVWYKWAKAKKDAGNNVGQILSMQNAGEGKPNAYIDGNSGTNKYGIKYDTADYAKKVATIYQQIKAQSDNTSPNLGNGNSNSDTSSAPQTFEDYLKQNPPGSQPETNNSALQAGNPTTPGNTTIGNAVADLTPGSKLAQGAGYGLAAATGSQKGLINAQNQGIDIQGKLLQQLKSEKAKGKDTTKLESALKNLGIDIGNEGGQVSDIGTGGIKNSDVTKSAAGLAALPVASYLGGALSGGGIMNEGKGLITGALSKTSSSVLANPTITRILESTLGKGETVANLSRQDAINALGNTLKEMSVSESGGKTEQLVLKALQELNPTLSEKVSLGSKIAKLLGGAAKTAIAGTILGGAINKGEKIAGLLK